MAGCATEPLLELLAGAHEVEQHVGVVESHRRVGFRRFGSEGTSSLRRAQRGVRRFRRWIPEEDLPLNP
jgi:hypothetical protein